MLRQRAFDPLPLGAVRPTGWLRNQLAIQAAGLSGHLDEFWPDIAQSQWIGGDAEGWERGPYWLDGVTPLAYLLDDDALKAKVVRWMDYILTHQQDDGWLGPVSSKGHEGYDAWPGFVALKAMTQYFEATGDDRVIPAMTRFLQRVDALIDEKPLFEWGRFRWADLVISIHWLHERSGEDWLLDLARKAHDQGYDWRALFENFEYTSRIGMQELAELSGKYFGTDENTGYFDTHVVNNAMGIKQPGVWWRQSGDDGDRDAVHTIIETLDRYHGQATGVFTGDEHLAGLNPSQGTELCAVAEYMYSLEVLTAIFGEACFGDRLERIAFNALPAPFKPDMWARQYDQQANQVLCAVVEDRVYTNNHADANVFGLEPNFGCCTANMHQAWPKLASHLWMDAKPGLVAVAYAPCTVRTQVDGVTVVIDEETNYPFDDTITLRVRVDGDVAFPLVLRIPEWTESAEISIDGGAAAAPEPGAFHRIERTWSGETVVALRFPMRASVERRFNNSAVIKRGPLVYALKMGEDWRKLKGEEPHADWEVHPTTPWNYALDLAASAPESLQFDAAEPGACPFSPEGAPVRVRVKGRRLDGWEIEHGAAGTLPESPVQSGAALEELELIPYGCTNLRVTEFPVLGTQ